MRTYTKTYAGIGSRDVPKWVEELIIKTGTWLAQNGYTLRSGGANGCDLAFEKGCDLVNGKKEIYLPWYKFNYSTSQLYLPSRILEYEGVEIEFARKYHPCFDKLSDGAKKLQIRNSYQVLGNDLETPCHFIICYTKNGNGSGGTGQALRIAKDYNIPIFDFGIYRDVEECRKYFMEFMQKLNVV